MICSRGVTKTIVLKSPDSEKVREVIVTSVLLPKSENENNRTLIKPFKSSEDIELVMEKRMCKRRLDHLTLEEKILRKKLKNREAAQTSRDKKKARLEELEAAVLKLQNENETLHEEVRSLKDDKERLERDNVRLTEEVWRLNVAGGTSGPAAGSQSAPSTPPRPPSPCFTPNPSFIPDSISVDDWDWLDNLPITPVVEELEQLANSLIAEACNSQEAEAQETNMVGSKTESLEPCWPCITNKEDNCKTTNEMTTVTYPVVRPAEKNEFSSLYPNLDVTLAQTFNKRSLDTPEILELSGQPKLSSTVVFDIIPKNKDCTVDQAGEKDIDIPPADLNMMCVDDSVTYYSGDSMDCVINEEVVETTEYIALSSPTCPVPTIVLTETADISTEDDVYLNNNLLTPRDLVEESSSDHGYESYDSPISEPDQLVNLFPELW